jgi:hypothetical protein
MASKLFYLFNLTCMKLFSKMISVRCFLSFLLSALVLVSAPLLSHAALIKIGDEYRGGRVVYIFQPGDLHYKANEQHGLIAAREDLPQESFNWFDAKVAAERLEIDGNKGWSLPTLDELKRLYQNKAVVGGFRDYSYYWSSTEIDQKKVFVLDFYNGEQVVSLKSGALSGIRRIRPVQIF